jgi:hypothetical protein
VAEAGGGASLLFLDDRRALIDERVSALGGEIIHGAT